MSKICRYTLLALVCVSIFSMPVEAKQEASFSQWLGQLKIEARQQGISDRVINEVLGKAKFNESVIKLDRKQPEGKITFSQYRKNIVNKKRIEAGRVKYKKHQKLLNEISAYYGVPAQYIVALWGIETNYGTFTGKTSTVNALATMAYEGRRADFFKKELLILLKLFSNGDIADADLRGSWAGAMGHSQFMPSSFVRFAVDWNKNGEKDIWNELPDVFASIANYLKQEGWNNQLPWGVAIERPVGRSFVYDDLYTPLKYEQIRKQNIRLQNAKPVAAFNGNGYLMHPGEPDEGSFLVYDNYHVLLKWNRSRYFATAVGLLADAIKAK